MPVSFIAVRTRIEAGLKSIEEAVSTPDFDRVCKEVSDGIITSLTNAEFTNKEGEALKSMIMAGMFPRLTKDDLYTKISGCSVGPGVFCCRKRLQDFTAFPKLTPQIIWDKIRDKKFAAFLKSEMLLKFLALRVTPNADFWAFARMLALRHKPWSVTCQV